MTPDVFTNLRVLNCTNFALESNNIGSYQMQSWFPNVSILAGPQSFSAQYLLQFLRGGGDEDDAGNITMAIDSENVVFLYAGSAPDSAHYMQVTLTSPSGSPSMFAIGLVTDGDWPQSAELASAVNWCLPTGQVVGLGNLAVPGGTNQYSEKALAIVDLSQIFSPEDASTIQQAIQGNTLTTQQVADLWTNVSSYTHILGLASA